MAARHMSEDALQILFIQGFFFRGRSSENIKGKFLTILFKNLKIWNRHFFCYEPEQFEVKKHTGRKAGVMTTSCSSTNQITTVKNLAPLKTQVIFLNSTDIHLC